MVGAGPVVRDELVLGSFEDFHEMQAKYRFDRVG
jgi:hypothetical protein